MATDPYEPLARAVAKAGFFTNGVEDHGTWHRTCVCSRRRQDGTLGGNSFWVSRLPGGWYLGTWGGSIYELPDADRLTELCVAWLSCRPDATAPDFDPWLKQEFGLVPVTEEEFDGKVGRPA